MDYYYPPLQAVLDGWILLLLIVVALIAARLLRGLRRTLVVAGFGLWAFATILWFPAVAGVAFEPLFRLMDAEAVWLIPLVPWLVGSGLLTAGIVRRPKGLPAYASPSPPDFPPPTTPDDPPADFTSPGGPAAPPGAPNFLPPSNQDGGGR